MKIAFLSLVLSLNLISLAHADGFVCTADDSGIKIKVYNQVEPNLGTRSPAVMIISDPTLVKSNQTLVTFSSNLQNLSYRGKGLYSGQVQINAIQNKDALLAGTKLEQLNTIELEVVFSYNTDSTTLAKAVDMVPATLHYYKVSGEAASESATCFRYLKDAKPSVQN